MNKFTLLINSLLITGVMTAQETVVNLSAQSNYSQDVYLGFENSDANNFDVAIWELAFNRNGFRDLGTRINDGLGIEVYIMSVNPADYDAVSPNDINENTPRHYNSDTAWDVGAFDQVTDPNNPFWYGWGVYNPATHHVDGMVTFMLKYPDNTFKKFMIEDFMEGFTFKYATWNAASNTWINSQTGVVSNADNEGMYFNFFSLTNNQAVVASPNITAWDLVFQKYFTDVEGTMYPVFGALQNPNTSVAISTNPDATLSELTFFEEINTVGYDWKQFEGGSYTVNSDTYYYIKTGNDKLYRFRFLSFEGASTGDFSLAYEDVSERLSVSTFEFENMLNIYPNPITEGQVYINYDIDKADNLNVEVYTMNGQRILSKSFNTQYSGTTRLDLSGISAGIYIMKITSGKNSTTKKLVLKQISITNSF